MNEVYNADGTPHATNARSTIDDDDNDFWFGFEQEYFLWDPDTNLPLGFPRDQTPQGQLQAAWNNWTNGSNRDSSRSMSCRRTKC